MHRRVRSDSGIPLEGVGVRNLRTEVIEEKGDRDLREAGDEDVADLNDGDLACFQGVAGPYQTFSGTDRLEQRVRTLLVLLEGGRGLLHATGVPSSGIGLSEFVLALREPEQGVATEIICQAAGSERGFEGFCGFFDVAHFVREVGVEQQVVDEKLVGL